MLDPFPFAAPKWLVAASTPLADALGLHTLPQHIHEVILTAALYFWVQNRFSPWISSKIAPKSYLNLNPRTKLNWDVHVVSLVQSVVVCSVAAYVMKYDDERRTMDREERVWGYTGGTGLVQAVGLGYFVYDIYTCTRYVKLFGIGMLAHALSAVTVFSFGFRPFVNYYSPDFILYELSSPFLNVHWFCDKLDLTGSNLQLVNGIFLICTFVSCRLIWGTYASFSVFRDVLSSVGQASSLNGTTAAVPPQSPIPVLEDVGIMRYAGNKEAPFWLCAAYAASNITLNSLNWYWINKMIATIRKRFDPPFGTRRPEKEDVEVDVARGIDAAGTKSVEINASEIRRRPTVPRNVSDLPMA